VVHIEGWIHTFKWMQQASKHFLLGPESHCDDDRSRDNDDDVTSTDTWIKDKVLTRRSYLEALLQWAKWLTLCDLLVKLVQYTLFDLLVLVCLDWMTVAST
jgi:hypothetical protein